MPMAGVDALIVAAIDGTARYIGSLLRCPELALRASRNGILEEGADSLARHCNFR